MIVMPSAHKSSKNPIRVVPECPLLKTLTILVAVFPTSTLPKSGVPLAEILGAKV